MMLPLLHLPQLLQPDPVDLVVIPYNDHKVSRQNKMASRNKTSKL
jgi:hypothetical protein